MTSNSVINAHCKFIAIFLALFVVQQSQTTELPVCCPTGSYLIETSSGLFKPNKFECRSGEVPGNLKSARTDGLFGVQVIESNRSAIPTCDSPILIKVNDRVHLSPRSCLVRIFNELHAISCRLEANDVIQPVTAIRKCCPYGTSFDRKARKCVESHEESFEALQNISNHPIVFTEEPLLCSDDDVIVEYFSDTHQMKIDDYGILVVGSSEKSTKFDTASYCVEVLTEPYGSNFTASDWRTNFMVRSCNSASVCDEIPCVRRCCGDWQKYVRINNTPQCVPDSGDVNVIFHDLQLMDKGEFVEAVPKAFGSYRGLDCKKYKLDPSNYKSDIHYISHRDGSIFFPESSTKYDNSQYCTEKFYKNENSSQISTFLCFEDTEKDALKFNLYSIGLLISSFFFGLTLLVYCCIPKLRNLPGKILICLVSSLMTAYLGIAIGQIKPPSDNICYMFAFFIYFSLMAAFAWMNVMCFDIWLTFGSSEHSHGFKRQKTWRFVVYSLYGWGLPCLLTMFTAGLTKYDLLSKELRPNFGHGRCWFTHVHAASEIIFFLAPVGILFLINFILFVFTMKYCNKVKREIHRMQSSNIQKPVLKRRFFVDNARFMMNTKLFVVMGITWFLEILSLFFYDRKRTFFWVVSDSFNILQGVLVFLIFVFKWRVWYAILAKLGIKQDNTNRLAVTNTAVTNSTYALNTAPKMMRMRSTETASSLLTVPSPHKMCAK